MVKGLRLMYDANQIKAFKRVSWKIHNDDEMYLTAKIMMPEKGHAFHYYFYSGGFVALNTKNYLQAKGLDLQNLSLLDFACGYGRITRYFAHHFRDVTGSDLDEKMLSFIQDEFGVPGFLSNVKFRNIKFPPKQFDVVFCFSLFTHLHPDIWADWFWCLFEKVKKGGYYMITTRSPEFANTKGDNLAGFDGVAFKEKNETRGRLDSQIYGQTTVNRAFVEKIAASKPNLLEYADYFAGGDFDLFQDVHVFRRIL